MAEISIYTLSVVVIIHGLLFAFHGKAILRAYYGSDHKFQIPEVLALFGTIALVLFLYGDLIFNLEISGEAWISANTMAGVGTATKVYRDLGSPDKSNNKD